MSATSSRQGTRGARDRRRPSPRADDPRVIRSRSAVVSAATTLFLQKGYAGTTMEDIAALAGIAKRTVYNLYTDKETLFTQIVNDTIAYAEDFARTLRAERFADTAAPEVAATLHDLGRRLALSIVRPEVIALRRLLIGEAREFPALARKYFDRAPDQVMNALALAFDRMRSAGLLRMSDTRRAAEQFAYLIVGAPLDRAMLVSVTPTKGKLIAGARDGVDTFLKAYGSDVAGRSAPAPRSRRARASTRRRP